MVRRMYQGRAVVTVKGNVEASIGANLSLMPIQSQLKFWSRSRPFTWSKGLIQIKSLQSIRWTTSSHLSIYLLHPDITHEMARQSSLSLAFEACSDIKVSRAERHAGSLSKASTAYFVEWHLLLITLH